MVASDLIKMDFTNDNLKIEAEMKARGIEPLRWAVVEVSDEYLSISVSYET